MGVLAKLLFWLHQSCAQDCNLSFGPRIGGAMGMFVLATFTLLRQQNIWLERRCNDAERGWAVGEWLFKISIGLAFIGLLSSRAALLLIALGWVQFVYGLALPANPLPNIQSTAFRIPTRPRCAIPHGQRPRWRRCCRLSYSHKSRFRLPLPIATPKAA